MFDPIDSTKIETRRERVVPTKASRAMRLRPSRESASQERKDKPQPNDASAVLSNRMSAASAQQNRAASFGEARDHLLLEIGSDVEICKRLLERLKETYGRVAYAEGQLWRYAATHWEAFPEHKLRALVQEFDGARYPTPSGSVAWIKLGKGKINSILHELLKSCSEPGFFDARAIGINCASGFIRFSEKGMPTLRPHSPEHRARHTLCGHWKPGRSVRLPPKSLLRKLLDGVFKGDPDRSEKVQLLAEICGVAALGHAAKLLQPRSVILYGPLAENGKGQILDLVRGLLPEAAVCSIPPAIMSDERHIIALAGKLLNATDELSSAAIASDRFKSVITGDPVPGRDVYKSRIEFRPMAQHLFAANALPPFIGGMDRGVQRRLCVVPFNRIIPVAERIEGIGKLVGQREPDLLLAWAIDGAARALREGVFTIPSSCRQALREWIFAADPVAAWIEERVKVEADGDVRKGIKTRDAYTEFRSWAAAEGFKTLPEINGFVQRVLSAGRGIEHRRSGKEGRRFIGMRIRRKEEI